VPGTAVGIFLVDFILRPFARVLEKWSIESLVLLMIVYGIVGYVVVRSTVGLED
jgi:hypothetical protein